MLIDPAAAVSPGLKGEYCWDGWLGCSFFNYPRENMTLLVMQQQLNGGDVVTGVKKALVCRMEGRERGQEG